MNNLNTISLADIVALVIGIINSIIGLLVTLALVLFLYTGYRLIATTGEKGGDTKAREALRWSLIALFVIVSVWGILRIMCSTFIGASNCGNQPPPHVQRIGF